MNKEKEAGETADVGQADLEKVTQICQELKEIPMADILVDIFLEHADPESFRIGRDFTGEQILADPKGEKIDASLMLSRCLNRVDLEIFDGSTRAFPTEDLNKRYCCTIGFLYAGQKTTGTWSCAGGYEQTYGIMARFIGDLILPSERAKWVFELFDEITQKTNERYSLNQPRFYLDDETIPEPARV
jgi:hypothetical protein